MMTTLRDVAQRAGVSAMTVSNVVNGREGKVSAATLGRVQAAIAELGYVPNAQARALAGASSRIIALVYGTNDVATPLTLGHESAFTAACEAACREHGLALMLCAAVHGHEQEMLRRLGAWRVEGVIALGSVPARAREALAGLGVPVVLVDTPQPAGAIGYRANIVRVGVDDQGGGRLAGEHLAAAGHRHVVYAAPYPGRSQVDEDRLAGLREGLQAGNDESAPGTVSVRVVTVALDFHAGVRVGCDLATEMGAAGETAVFVSGDVPALGIVAGLRREGCTVPGDVSVVAFDGFEVSSYCDPVLTAVAQPVQDKAAQAVDLIAQQTSLARSGHKDTHEVPRAVVLPVSWREGGTLGRAHPARVAG